MGIYSAVFFKLCGIAGAQVMTPICELRREGFSPSSGRMRSIQSQLCYLLSLSFLPK